jgi:hypothetical protein
MTKPKVYLDPFTGAPLKFTALKNGLVIVRPQDANWTSQPFESEKAAKQWVTQHMNGSGVVSKLPHVRGGFWYFARGRGWTGKKVFTESEAEYLLARRPGLDLPPPFEVVGLREEPEDTDEGLKPMSDRDIDSAFDEREKQIQRSNSRAT